jgi:hypothetical protein
MAFNFRQLRMWFGPGGGGPGGPLVSGRAKVLDFQCFWGGLHFLDFPLSFSAQKISWPKKKGAF